MKSTLLVKKLFLVLTASVTALTLCSASLTIGTRVARNSVELFRPLSHIRFDRNSWSFQIEGVTLANFPGLPQNSTAEVSSLYIKLDPAGLLTGELRIKELDIQMGSLMIRKANSGRAGFTIPIPPIFTRMVIENIRLKLDRIILERETSKDGPASLQSKDVNLKARYRNIRDYAKFSRDIEGRLKRRVIRNAVRNADPFGVTEVVESVFKSSKWTLTEITQLGTRILI